MVTRRVSKENTSPKRKRVNLAKTAIAGFTHFRVGLVSSLACASGLYDDFSDWN